MGFLYDEKEGTVLGRDAKSWFKILLFYAIYYTFLFCLLYAFTFMWYEGTMPKVDQGNKPYTDTRLDQPGAAVHPFKETYEDADRQELTLNSNLKDKMTKQYVDDFVKFIDNHNATLNKDAVWCSEETKHSAKQSICKTAEIKREQVENWIKAKTPPVAIDMNKVIGWKPFNQLNTNFPEGARRVKNAIYFDCYEYDKQKAEQVSKAVTKFEFKVVNPVTGKFSPELKYPAITPNYFPFLGDKDKQPIYNKPFATLLVKNTGKWDADKFYNFRCLVLADNIDAPVLGSDHPRDMDLLKLGVGHADFGFKFTG